MLRGSGFLRHARVFLWGAALAASPLLAQWTTPAIDGSIGTNEYGANNQLNNAGNTGQTWYMTWDATNLYVAITTANLSEGAVLYIGANPPTPPNGGTNANGNLSGFNSYDGSYIASLPFRAQFVTYFKDGYNEYRTADGSGNWTGPTSNYGAYASSGSNGNVREFAIPWNAVTGGTGLPSSFVFLGYLTSSGGYIYGQAPSDNPGGQTAGGGGHLHAVLPGEQHRERIEHASLLKRTAGRVSEQRDGELCARHVQPVLSEPGRSSSGGYAGGAAIHYRA